MSKKNPTIQTTKLGNKVQKGKGKKPEKKTEAEEHVLNAGEEPVGHKETIRFFFGLVLLILALFMLLSFTSHLFTGAEDQCLIEQGAMEGFLNYAGAVGALLRQLLDKPLFRILGLHPSRFSDYCSHETDPRL